MARFTDYPRNSFVTATAGSQDFGKLGVQACIEIRRDGESMWLILSPSEAQHIVNTLTEGIKTAEAHRRK